MKRTPLTALALVLGLAAACGGDRAADKKESPAPAPAANASATTGSQAASLLPAKNEVPGWSVSKAPRTFTADNLWELIDGAADGFVTYGVQEVATAEYTQAGTNYQAEVEVYQFKDALNAFGKYSEERNPQYQFLKVGNEGYSGGTSVNFWSGPYYVKITSFEEKDATKQENEKLAQAIAAKVPSPGGEPRQIGFLPKENQLPHTARYIPKDVLAQSYFTNGFEARYKGTPKESRLILMELDSPAAAEDALSRYRQYLTKSGKDVKDLKATGEAGFTGKDSFYGNLAAARAGKHVAVSLGVATEDLGKKQVAEVLGNVR